MVKSRKKNLVNHKKNKPRASAKEVLVSNIDPPRTTLVKENVWDDAVSSLRNESFHSIDQVINAVVDRVLEKMLDEKDRNSTIRSFLYDVLETDITLRQELSSIFGL